MRLDPTGEMDWKLLEWWTGTFSRSNMINYDKLEEGVGRGYVNRSGFKARPI